MTNNNKTIESKTDWVRSNNKHFEYQMEWMETDHKLISITLKIST